VKSFNNYKVDYKANRIQLFDTRWYEVEGEKYPSVTTILNAKSKPYALQKWVKQLGLNADAVSAEAMEEGSEVHDMCERYMRGEEIVYTKDTKFHEVWRPFLRFVEWVTENNVEPILLEQTIFSKEHGYAGTMDLLCTVENKSGKAETWLIDLKRSKQSSESYEYQIGSYMKALIEMGLIENNVKGGVLLLNVETKKGYRLVEVEDIDMKFDIFLAVKKIWDAENLGFDMTTKTYPTVVKREIKQENKE
jgi:hypothetical protein